MFRNFCSRLDGIFFLFFLVASVAACLFFQKKEIVISSYSPNCENSSSNHQEKIALNQECFLKNSEKNLLSLALDSKIPAESSSLFKNKTEQMSAALVKEKENITPPLLKSEEINKSNKRNNKFQSKLRNEEEIGEFKLLDFFEKEGKIQEKNEVNQDKKRPEKKSPKEVQNPEILLDSKRKIPAMLKIPVIEKKGLSSLGGLPMPQVLEEVPFAEDRGIVIGTQTVSVRGIEAPYNASIIENGANYQLFFRYDKKIKKDAPSFYSYIGCCELDKSFVQTEKEFITINTGSDFSEDPRAILQKEKLIIVYNDIVERKKTNRTLHVAQLKREDLEMLGTITLDLSLQPVEKNWVPFVSPVSESIFFEYTINPHKILELAKVEDVYSIFTDQAEPTVKVLPWKGKWGEVRGGTPAKLVDEQYLGFFHTLCKDKQGFIWYLMGAYTFEKEYPFNLKAISSTPILFKGIYDTQGPTVSKNKRCIYPSGFVVEKKGEKELIHVSCGENDASIKMVTFDKEALLKSLDPI